MKSIREGTLRLVAVASLIPFLVTAIGDLTESGNFNVDGLIKNSRLESTHSLAKSHGSSNSPQYFRRPRSNHRQLWTGSSAYPPIGQPILGSNDDSLGSSLSLSADGTVLAVGSWSRQKIFMYRHVGTTWQSAGVISYGGGHVSLSSDGKRVGTVQGMNVYVFEIAESGNTWIEVFNVAESDADFNRGVSLSPDGTTIGASGANTSSGQGIVQVWNQPVDGGNWESVANFSMAEGNFGYSLGVHDDLVVVGSPTLLSSGTDAGRVFVYEKAGVNWSETVFDGSTGDYFGSSLAISENGVNLVACASLANGNAGYCRFFDKSSGSWQLSSVDDIIGVSDEYLGENVALSRDATTVTVSGGFRFEKDAVASTVRGTIRLYTLDADNTTWYSAISPIYEVENGFLGHGLALSADGGKIAISDPQFPVQGGDTSGEVRAYFTKRINLSDSEDFATSFDGCSPAFVGSETEVTCTFTTSPYAYSVASAKDGPCENYQIPAGELPTISGSNVVDYIPAVTTEEKNAGGTVEKVFCIRSDVMTAIDSSGTLMNVDASKMEVTLKLDFDTSGSFTMDIATSAFVAESTNAEATRSVVLDAYQCDENGDISDLQLSVGQSLHICVETPSTATDITITDITSLVLKDFLANDMRTPITDGQTDFITSKDCSLGTKCIVGTLLVPSLFDNYLNDENLIIQVVGVADIEYTTGRRDLQPNPGADGDRSLQGNSEQSSFFMSFDVSQRDRMPFVVGPRPQDELPMVAQIMYNGVPLATETGLTTCLSLWVGTAVAILVM